MQYASKTLGAALGYGVPITETDTINFGGRFEHTNITLFSDSPPVYQDFVNQFGESSNAYILTAGWAPGLTAPPAQSLVGIHNVASVAKQKHLRLFLVVWNSRALVGDRDHDRASSA